MHQTILILGGDGRQAHLASLLRARGFQVMRPVLPCEDAVLKAAVRRCAAVLLPYPVSRDDVSVSGEPKGAFRLDAVLSSLTDGQRIIGGGFSPAQRAALDRAGVRWTDCTEDEAFLLYNAALTAQGALRLLLCSTDDDLRAGRTLVTGFGRVGRAVSGLLRALSCDVTVAARGLLQRRDAASLGCRTVGTEGLDPSPFHVIINTVPHRLFSADTALRFRADARYLELASPPFGADEADVGCLYLNGTALPGRFSPKAAARAWLPLVDAALNGGEDSSTPPSVTPSPGPSAASIAP